MKFVLFVEGHTEKTAIAGFLKRWLDPQLSKPVGISPVRFDGWAELVKDPPTKARLHLEQPNVIAVISLLGLYGPTIYPPEVTGVEKRYMWAKQYLEKEVNQKNFFQFFAVHEVEAWLLSDSSIFPGSIKTAVEALPKSPESINNTQPPSRCLNRIYNDKTRRTYKKPAHGKALFNKLDPEKAGPNVPI